jgi:hypothetical protein
MKFLNDAKTELNNEIEKAAKTKLFKRLNDQGIDPHGVSTEEIESMIKAEIELLQSDTKKVGAGFGLGVAFTLLTGL